MKENQNDEEFLDEYTKARVEKGIKDLLEEKELKMQWRRELAENESVQRFFTKYKPQSIESFVDSYITYKFIAHRYAELYSQKAEEKRGRWINKAHEHLKFIQQKKLFDLQCLWRAEQIQLEGIEICFDFEIWKQDIYNCLFLAPVNKDDVEQYQSFLLQNDEYYEFEMYGCQDYDEIKEEYSGSDEICGAMPDWYEYHNLVTGNSSRLLLPDIRGEKELFYRSYTFKKNQEQLAQAESKVIDMRPSISWHEEKDADFFVKTFDDRETQIKFDNYIEDNKAGRNKDIEIDSLIYDMIEQEETIPIEAHYDFVEGLKKAYVKFRNGKIAEHLPLAHEQYLFNKQMGFEIERDRPTDANVRELCLKQILDGREANGEPRDLNF